MNVVQNRLASVLSQSWWVLLLRGLLAIAFGVITWAQPGISLAALVIVFGVYAIADGVLGIWIAFAGRQQNDDWWILLLWGVLGIGAGIVTFVAPGLTALALVFYIAAWAIATGVLQIVGAIRLRTEIKGEWLLILSGVVSVAFGAYTMVYPGTGALAVLWTIATYAIVLGILLVLLAFKVRGVGRTLAIA